MDEALCLLGHEPVWWQGGNRQAHPWTHSPESRLKSNLGGTWINLQLYIIYRYLFSIWRRTRSVLRHRLLFPSKLLFFWIVLKNICNIRTIQNSLRCPFWQQIKYQRSWSQIKYMYVYHLDSEDRHLLAGGTDDVRLFVSSRIDSSWSLWHLVDASGNDKSPKCRSWIRHGLVAVLTYK